MKQTYRSRQKALIERIRADVRTVSAQASVVPMQVDYAADPGRCLTSVMFVPPQKADRLEADVQQRLALIEPHHYYNPPDSMHITIKNVRVTRDPPAFDEDDIARVHSSFTEIVPRQSCFPFSFEELVIFPNSISLIGYSGTSLQRLVRALDDGLSAINLQDDKRYLSDEVFFGNITLCRFTQPPSMALIKAVDQLNRDRGPINVCLSHIELITCNSAATPGAIQRLHRYELKPIPNLPSKNA